MDLRFNRIEVKLDKLSEAMTLMARIDERMAHNQDAHARVWRQIEAHAARLHELETASGNNTFITRRAERIYWIVVVAMVGAAIKWAAL